MDSLTIVLCIFQSLKSSTILRCQSVLMLLSTCICSFALLIHDRKIKCSDHRWHLPCHTILISRLKGQGKALQNSSEAKTAYPVDLHLKHMIFTRFRLVSACQTGETIQLKTLGTDCICWRWCARRYANSFIRCRFLPHDATQAPCMLRQFYLSVCLQ